MVVGVLQGTSEPGED